MNAWRLGREHLTRLVNTATAFIRSSGAESADGITVSSIEQWAASLHAAGQSAKTILNKLSAIDRFCDYLYARGLLLSNPARAVRRPRPEQTVPNWLTRREMACVIRLARSHGLLCEVVLACYAGLRVGELQRLQWRDVDLARRALLVRKSKSGRPRTVWLHPMAVIALRRQRQLTGRWAHVFPGGRGAGGGGTWGRQGPRGRDWWLKRALRPLQAACPAFARLPKGSCGRGWHLFRHTWCSLLVQGGVSAAKIAQWAGHGDLRTIQRYTHLADEYDPDVKRMGRPR
ncbi:MAG TPA: site-specific integrase [Phycisphaerae bacterium]|nr:site-specific integrase [Phycisphaerae bacterium]